MFIPSIHQAKTHLSKLINNVLEGEEVIIGKAGKPLVKLTIYTKPPKQKKRKLGLWKGKGKIHDDFDELPEDIMSSFMGEDI